MRQRDTAEYTKAVQSLMFSNKSYSATISIDFVVFAKKNVPVVSSTPSFLVQSKNSVSLFQWRSRGARIPGTSAHF